MTRSLERELMNIVFEATTSVSKVFYTNPLTTTAHLVTEQAENFYNIGPWCPQLIIFQGTFIKIFSRKIRVKP